MLLELFFFIKILFSGWPFWTKLVVVAVGFTGGAVFMYIQCRQYFTLCSRWRCHNRYVSIVNNSSLNLLLIVLSFQDIAHTKCTGKDPRRSAVSGHPPFEHSDIVQ